MSSDAEVRADPRGRDSESTVPPTARLARRPRFWRPGRVIVLLVAAGFFFGPAVAGALGFRAGQIENHRLATFPSPREGWAFFPRLNSWTVDHLPLRGQAVRLNTRIAESLFGEPPSYGSDQGRNPVIQGKGDWLFYSLDFQWACHPVHPPADMVRRANRLASIVTRTGARFVLVVPPDKTTIETGELPARYPNAGCGPRHKQAFWDYISAHQPDGYLDLYGPLRQLDAEQGPLYRSKDTHWAPRAAAEYARLLVGRVDPELWRSSQVVNAGTMSPVGDLTRMLGAPSVNTVDDIQISRPGVTVPPYRGGKIGRMGVARFSAESTDAPVYTDPVTVIGDSFSGSSYPQVTPFFGDLTSINNVSATHSPDSVATSILNSKLVVAEFVERAFATGRAPLLEDANLDALAQAVDRQLAKR